MIQNNQIEILELKYLINETKNSIDGLNSGPKKIFHYRSYWVTFLKF